ncbi:AMP-binding protein, partial [candidate division KSB3 bacterium]|nr:AMP-binding protein [candidate division KSB3 bacterium]MBD3323252.1 AMP-binding protein [candidate division KSB3 bacterium]
MRMSVSSTHSDGERMADGNQQREVRVSPLDGQEDAHDEHHALAFSREDIDRSLPERFARIVQRFPDRPAVKTDQQMLTYRELDQASNQVAHAILTQRDARPEPVILLLDYDILQLVALLGVLKAGKCYAFLSPSFPFAQLRTTVDDLQAPLIVTTQSHRALASELASHTTGIITCDALESSDVSEISLLTIPPDTVAQILYTSGSTGTSKGVLHTHRTVLHRIMTWTNRYHLCARDRWLYFGALGVGRSTIATLGTLLNGATLCFFDLRHQGFAQVATWLMNEKITIYHSLPTVFRRLLEMVTTPETFASIRLVILYAENVYKQDIQKFHHYFPPHGLLHIGLASTETNSISEYLVHYQTPLPRGHLVPVGYAAEDKEILLLDEQRQPVGGNQIGEIAVRSRYLSPGYWRDPDLTRQKFLPDPAGGDTRIYLTGDLGRMSPDGCLEYLGRKDFQVKIRGHRVVLTEIEATLHGLEGVNEAVVTAQQPETGDAYLVAYVVPAERPAPTVSDLRRALAATLPGYMLPACFMFLDALPLSPTGKVDRQALPAPDHRRPAVDVPYAAPRNATEQQLASIWADVLGLERVGIQDHFFDLGGDSIQAMRILAQVEHTIGTLLPTSVLLEAPTIARLATRLHADAPSSSWTCLVPIHADGSRPP